MPTSTSDLAINAPSVIGDVFGFGTDLLSFLPVWMRQFVVFVALAVLAAMLLAWTLRTFLPWAGPALARLSGAGVRLVGYLLLFVEYLPTRLFRLVRLRPPALVYAYDDLVSRVATGTETALRSGFGATRYLQKTPKWMVVTGLLLVLGGWNQAQCGGDDVDCHRPLDTWRASASAWFRTTFDHEGFPCPTDSPSPTEAEAAQPSPSPSCSPSPSPTS